MRTNQIAWWPGIWLQEPSLWLATVHYLLHKVTQAVF